MLQPSGRQDQIVEESVWRMLRTRFGNSARGRWVAGSASSWRRERNVRGAAQPTVAGGR